jgi:hypothetical protein
VWYNGQYKKPNSHSGILLPKPVHPKSFCFDAGQSSFLIGNSCATL